MATDSDSSSSAKDAVAKPAAGISHFLAKVFDQLSLTAWLPAVTLVGIGAVLVQMRISGTLDPATAVIDLLELGWGGLLLVLFALVIAAIITQAFSFESLRLLEGYWPNLPGFTQLRSTMLTYRRWQRKRLDRRIPSVESDAFFAIKTELLQVERPRVVTAIEDDVCRIPMHQRSWRSRRLLRKVDTVDWMARIDPRSAVKLERLYVEQGKFPAENRLLPMKLGNVLRSYEDRLAQSGQELEGYVMRSYEAVPARLMVQHDQFRNRLDLYCTMVPTTFTLAIAAVLLIPHKPVILDVPFKTTPVTTEWGVALAVTLAFLMLTGFCYRAAIASAEGYGAVLMAIKNYNYRKSEGATGTSSRGYLTRALGRMLK